MNVNEGHLLNEEIHRALANPMRRRIVLQLQQKGPCSFTELLKYLGIRDHGKLGYHLKTLKNLIAYDSSRKRYYLTDLGLLAAKLEYRIYESNYLIDTNVLPEISIDFQEHVDQCQSVTALQDLTFASLSPIIKEEIAEDPFDEYPDLGHVLDQMSREGLHLYYHRIRTEFQDEGTIWRQRWEPRIKIWMKKAIIWDKFSKVFDRFIISYADDAKDPLAAVDDCNCMDILEKIRSAFQAQKDLLGLEQWISLNANMKGSPEFLSFIEKIITEWKTSQEHRISSPLFEVAPKGTIEQLKEVKRILDFMENTEPVGKMDGIPVHSSEVLECVRLWLRFILGLPMSKGNLWAKRDVARIFWWTGLGRKLGYGETSSKPALSCAPDRRLTGPHIR